MILQKAFYMIRHGQTLANEQQVMAGSSDSPLTELGKRQAQSVQNIVKALPVKPKTIAHSHLSRARDTAHIINAVLGVDLHKDPDLAELNAGDWEGVSYAECSSLFYSFDTPPGGETFDEFQERLIRGKNRHIGAHAGPILIVCHGGVFRAFGRIYGIKTPGRFENCHLYEFIPNASNGSFPWDVSHYRLNDDGSLLKERAELYHEAIDTDEESAIAS